jgi:hypothetical protein
VLPSHLNIQKKWLNEDGGKYLDTDVFHSFEFWHFDF